MFRQQDMAFADALEFLRAQPDARLRDRGHPGGRQGVLREAGAASGRAAEPSSRCCCRTSDRAPGGAQRRAGAGRRARPSGCGVEPRSSARPASRATATLRRRPARLARLPARGRRPGRRRAGRRALPRAASPRDCSICMTTLPAVLRHRPDATRAVARRARRLQHARDDAVAASSAACAWPPRAACGTPGFDGPARRPRAGRACAACATSTAASACCSRRAASRDRAALASWPARSRARRSSCTSTSTCSTRRCCRRSSRRPAGCRDGGLRDAARRGRRRRDVVGVEVTAFERPTAPRSRTGRRCASTGRRDA